MPGPARTVIGYVVDVQGTLLTASLVEDDQGRVPTRNVRLPRLHRRRKKPVADPNTYYEELKAKQEAESAEKEAQRQEELEKVLKALAIKKE